MHLRLSVKRFWKVVRGNIAVSTTFLFLIAAALIVVPIQWVCAWILALTIHELCHYICLKLLGARVHKISIESRGVIMEAEPLSLGKEAICAYAGPVGSLLVLIIARYVPRTAICTLVFSAYNLLPVFPLDGGRGLGCLLRKFISEDRAIKAQRYIENAVLLGIVLIALYAVFRLCLGILPAVMAVILFWRSKGIKFPCKKCRLGLQ